MKPDTLRTIRAAAGAALLLAAAGPGAAFAQTAPPFGSTRLFFGPTARTLPRGHVTLTLHGLVLPVVQVGVTDAVQLGGGAFPALFEGGPPVVLTTKLRVFSRGQTGAAIGLVHAKLFGDVRLSVAYAAVTAGSDRTAVTVSVGRAYGRDDDGDAETFTLAMVGVEHRLSPSAAVVAEAQIVADAVLPLAGVRLTRGRGSFDAGLLVPISVDGFFAAPFFNFAWRF
jgi:hypothetical protein